MVNNSYEVEYCDLELRFDRQRINHLIKSFIEEGYSLYWHETENRFIISLRTGQKIMKLTFQLLGDKYKLVGNYVLKDQKLTKLMEKMIGDTRGHAVVKRISNEQIVVEKIMYGELIRSVEINGMQKKVVFEKEPAITVKEMIKAFKSKRAEQRMEAIKVEVDDELSLLHSRLKLGESSLIAESKTKLEALRREMMLLEM